MGLTVFSVAMRKREFTLVRRAAYDHNMLTTVGGFCFACFNGSSFTPPTRRYVFVVLRGYSYNLLRHTLAKVHGGQGCFDGVKANEQSNV